MVKPGPSGATWVDKIYFHQRDVTTFEGLGDILHPIHSAVGVSSVSDQSVRKYGIMNGLPSIGFSPQHTYTRACGSG